MEVLGKIKVINPLQQVSASFQKQELVVTTDEQYPQFISINFVQDKCDLLKNYKVGDNVKVSVNLRGREWINPQGETKYFNDIQGWRIESVNDEVKYKHEPPFIPATNLNEEDHNDLPF
jgi:single-stranded DNA-binding protein